LIIIELFKEKHMKRILPVAVILVSALVIMSCSITLNLFDETPIVTASVNTVLAPTLVPTAEIILPTTLAQQPITIYFMDENRFIAATEPYEVPVTRTVFAGSHLPRAVLDEYFKGPSEYEYSQGLRPLNSGFTHVRNLEIDNGIARVYLGGVCANNGAAYSVTNVIMKNLSQFPEITYVKIYDENDSNLDPDSLSSSLPYCLEP
jgi:hypothetical protein